MDSYKVKLNGNGITELENAIARAKMVMTTGEISYRVRTRLGANTDGAIVKEITFYYSEE